MSSKQSKNSIEIKLNIGSRGIATGILADGQQLLKRLPVKTEARSKKPVFSVATEISTFKAALQTSRDEIKSLINKVSGKSVEEKEAGDVLESRLMALEDDYFIREVENEIESNNIAASTAINRSFQKFRELLQAGESYINDLDDIRITLLEHLGLKKGQTTDKNKIVYFPKLRPHQVARLARVGVKAVIIGDTAQNSHEMILCRALSLPAVYGPLEKKQIEQGFKHDTIVDANRGKVILQASEAQLNEYRKKLITVETRRKKDRTYLNKKYRIYANINDLSELEKLSETQCSGIGLYRSEFLLTNPEQKELDAYLDVFRAFPGTSPVIRLFDFSREKYFTPLKISRKDAGPLGVRSIRALLQEKTILKNQIRRILKTSAKIGLHARILIPMLTFVEEFEVVQKLTKSIAHEIQCPDPELGVMLETPASVALIPYLGTMVSFYSVGANDLLQYSLAIGRDEGQYADKASPLHPGFLNILQEIRLKTRSTPVTVCGEIAGNPGVLPILIALGYRNFSVSVPRIPEVIRMVNNLNISECKNLLRELENSPLIKERSQIVSQFLSTYSPS